MLRLLDLIIILKVFRFCCPILVEIKTNRTLDLCIYFLSLLNIIFKKLFN